MRFSTGRYGVMTYHVEASMHLSEHACGLVMQGELTVQLGVWTGIQHLNQPRALPVSACQIMMRMSSATCALKMLACGTCSSDWLLRMSAQSWFAAAQVCIASLCHYDELRLAASLLIHDAPADACVCKEAAGQSSLAGRVMHRRGAESPDWRHSLDSGIAAWQSGGALPGPSMPKRVAFSRVLNAGSGSGWTRAISTHTVTSTSTARCWQTRYDAVNCQRCAWPCQQGCNRCLSIAYDGICKTEPYQVWSLNIIVGRDIQDCTCRCPSRCRSGRRHTEDALQHNPGLDTWQARP